MLVFVRIGCAIAVIIVLAAVGAVAIGGRMMRDEVAAVWPGKLGALEHAPNRYHSNQDSAAAKTLKPLVDSLPLDEDDADYVASDYVRQQVGAAAGSVAPPPPPLANYMRAHAGQVVAIRDVLLTNAGRLQWELDLESYARSPATPNFRRWSSVGDLLAMHALQERAASDSWNDARAMEILARALWRRPEADAVFTAVRVARTANAVERLLPLPSPSWRNDVMRFDARTPALAAMQFEAWREYERFFIHPTLPLFMALRLRRERHAAETFAAERDCSQPVGRRSYWPMWQSVRRYDVEREATANVLAIEEHRAIVTASRCGGTWSFASGTLRYSRNVAGEPLVPLTLQLGRREGG